MGLSAMKRPLVTVFGGSGFIGRHLVRRLASEGFLVRVAVRDPEAAQFLKPMGDVGQIASVPADITVPDSVSQAVAGADVVINLVGILYEAGRNRFDAVQADGAATVARAANGAGAARMVQLSAIGADSNAPAAYARSKAAGEAAALAAFPEAMILRPSVVFGPEDGFFNQFAAIARISTSLPVFGARPAFGLPVRGEPGTPWLDLCGGGGPRFQPVYVGDVADAVMACLKHYPATGRTYELGGPRIYDFKALMCLVLHHIGRRRALMPVPFVVAKALGQVLQVMPKPLLTRDQVLLMERDNVVSEGALTLADLGVEATPAEVVLPTYLSRFRPPGLKDLLPA